MSIYLIDKLIADFDETISEADTIQLLVHAAAEGRGHEKDQVLAAWQATVEWYTTQYVSILDEWLGKRQPMIPQIDDQRSQKPSIRDFLKAFEALEMTSIHRVKQQRFLKGLRREQLREIGQQVQKRADVVETLSAMRDAGVTVEILSANWSQTLIEGAMEGLCDRVRANRLVFDERGNSTGGMELCVVSAHDKWKLFNARRSKNGQTAYIGDSISDLLAILSANIGGLVGDNRTVLRTIEQFQISTASVEDCQLKFALEQGKGASSDFGIILRVNSWKALNCFLKRR